LLFPERLPGKLVSFDGTLFVRDSHFILNNEPIGQRSDDATMHQNKKQYTASAGNFQKVVLTEGYNECPVANDTSFI
jgi:hypothetical protein